MTALYPQDVDLEHVTVALRELIEAIDDGSVPVTKLEVAESAVDEDAVRRTLELEFTVTEEIEDLEVIDYE